jgi:hypothetical protein
MAMTMHCDIVSAETEIFSGLVTMVVANGTLGELGVLPIDCCSGSSFQYEGYEGPG